MHGDEIKNMLQQLISWDALELCPAKDENHVFLIPFVMNDAVESYLRLTGCTVQGELDCMNVAESDVQVVPGDSKPGIIIRQKNGNIVTIWYESAERITHLYQYHLIGHGWRKDAGEEDIRRLVNICCVLHDKRNYMGDICCNEMEQRIADLAACAPVLYYTPINESILSWYKESESGIKSALFFAEKANDPVLSEKFRLYLEAYRKGKQSERKMRALALVLCRSQHRRFWKEIEDAVDYASKDYEERCYSIEANAEITRQREKVISQYRNLGFAGEYPVLKKRCQAPNEIVVRFAEEQPFTVMEEQDFQCRIFSMTYSYASQGCVWRKETSWVHRM